MTPMPAQQRLGNAVRAALAAAGIAHVDDSPRRRAEYTSDASLYRVPPLVVAFPRSTEDVVAAVAVCRAFGVPLTTRGGGTSVAGNAVGEGVVLDTSRHLGRVLGIDTGARTALVQPGVILDDLQAQLAPDGLRFGPDPSTHSRCTVGGMIGNNACGARALSYGRTVDGVRRLEVVTGRGEQLSLGKGWPRDAAASLTAARQVADGTSDRVADEFGTFGRQGSGYGLEHLLGPGEPDLAKALVGSEGTLAVVVAAEVEVVAQPPQDVLVVLGYRDLCAAADAVPTLLRHRPVALEGLDRRIIDALRARGRSAAIPDLPDAGAWLLVEIAGPDRQTALDAAQAMISDAGAAVSEVLVDGPRRAAVWKVREAGAGIASRSATGDPAYAGWEDAAVPPERLGAYLREFEGLLEAHGLTGLPYGHLGDGCVHIRLDFPLRRPDGAGRFERFLADAAALVVSHGGSLSGEHGDGRARSSLLELMYSREAREAFAGLKAAFDPDGVLNPGVIVAPRPAVESLRPVQERSVRDGLALAYADDDGDLAQAASRCVGIAACRSGPTPGQVMCPSYLATNDEKDTTRGRARVLQETLLGAGGERSAPDWGDPRLHDALDLCLSCKGCARDCPTGVDMASYKAEVLYQTYRRRLRPRAHYTLGWLPRWAHLAGLAPRAANRLLQSSTGRRLVPLLAGIAAEREFPQFARRSLRQAVGDRPADRAGGPKAVMLADCFTDRFAPHAGAATLRVLEAAGYDVALSDKSACCGITWISTGQLRAARRRLRRLVDQLADAVGSDGIVVGVEPSCTAVLRSDAAELLGPDDHAVRRVSSRTRTLAETLLATPGWSPPDLTGTEVLAQPHCHHHAVMGWDADRAVLAQAGASVSAVGGCCGLAGNFGYERGHVEVSRKVAATHLGPALAAAGDDAVILADGFSCRTQIAQLFGDQARHLAELLDEQDRTTRTARPEA